MRLPCHFPRLITSIDFLKRERPMRLFREVLGHLLELNHQRYEEEVKLGLHVKKKKGGRRRAKKSRGKKQGSEDQMSLF